MPVTINGTSGITTPGIDASGTNKFATTIGVGGATPAASGAGITFPATLNASSDANTLDDYEEGTWTPVPTFGGANVGMSYSATGTYIKIGRMVFVNCAFNITANGSSTGTFRITGLPFVTNENAAGVYFGDGIVFTGASLLCVVESGFANTITLALQAGGTGSLGGWSYLDQGSTSGSGGKRLCVWYPATA